jgi:hypothetical protein
VNEKVVVIKAINDFLMRELGSPLLEIKDQPTARLFAYKGFGGVRVKTDGDCGDAHFIILVFLFF